MYYAKKLKIVPVRDITICIFIIFITVCLLKMPSVAAQSVSDSLTLCQNTIIPSLFPFLFLSSFTAKSGIATKAARLMNPITKTLFGLPGESAAAILLSLVGGYPSGVTCARSLRRDGVISEQTAAHLSLMAVSAGPAFLVGTVGGMLYDNIHIGLILLLSQALSVVILGVVLKFILHPERLLQGEKAAPSQQKGGAVVNDTRLFKSAAVQPNFSTVLLESAAESARTLLSICVFVMLFSLLGGLLEGLSVMEFISGVLSAIKVPPEIAEELFPSMLEVSSGVIGAISAGIPFVGFIVGFGGFSVHFQIFAITSELQIKKIKFFLSRLFQGAVCALLTWLFMKLLPQTAVEAALYSGEAVVSSTPNVGGSICLVIMCLMAVLCSPWRER